MFHCSLDYLLRDTEETDRPLDEAAGCFRKRFQERKSDKTLCGMPLWHIGRNARGFVAVGVNAHGVIAIGDFSVGALAIGKHFALGDNARAMIALGETQAAGTVFQKIGKRSPQEIAAVKQALDTIVPTWLSWAKEIIKLFI